MEEYGKFFLCKCQKYKVLPGEIFWHSFSSLLHAGIFLSLFCHSLDLLPALTFLLTAKTSEHLQCLPSVNWPEVVSDFLAVLTVKTTALLTFAAFSKNNQGLQEGEFCIGMEKITSKDYFCGKPGQNCEMKPCESVGYQSCRLSSL